MDWTLAIVGLLVVVLLVGVASYNGFIGQIQAVKTAWSNIDTEIRRRSDLIPNLVETVQGYATHERGVFEDVAKARASVGAASTPAEQAAAEGPLMAALGRLLAVAEAYPELKANANFLALQQELANTEDRLQTARRFYNGNVRDLNQRVQRFPSNLVARTFGFSEAEYFEVDEATREAGPPKVDFSR